MLVKRIKNNTAVTQEWLDRILEPGEYYDIQTWDEKRWATDSEILTAIQSGDAVVNNGTEDLNSTDGLNWLNYVDSAEHVFLDLTDFDSVNALNGIDETAVSIHDDNQQLEISSRIKELHISGNANVVDNGSHTVTVGIGSGSSLLGSLWQVDFVQYLTKYS
jgi:hypothetical protein